MPDRRGSERRNINPIAFSISLSAISTSKACRPLEVTIVNAGHLPPLHQRADGSVEALDGALQFLRELGLAGEAGVVELEWALRFGGFNSP